MSGAGNRLQQAIGNQACPQWQIAGRESLGAGDDVRLNSEHVLRRKPVAKPSEAGHDLIGDVEHVVGTAHLEAPLVIARRRNDDPARGQNRLGDEGADLVGPDLGNRQFQIRDLRVAPRLETRPVRPRRRIDVRKQMRSLALDVAPALAALLAGDRGGEIGRAVVRLLPRDRDLLLRSSQPIRLGPVTARNRFSQVPHCSGMGWKRPRMLAAMRGVKAEGGWGVVCTEYSRSIRPRTTAPIPTPVCGMPPTSATTS